MRTYQCTCGNRLYFDNTKCLQCGTKLGFDVEKLEIVAIEAIDAHWQSCGEDKKRYRLCRNDANAHVCNWLIPQQDSHDYCLACRLNEVIPDLGKEGNYQRWFKLEQAKRRLIYTLLTLHLPIIDFKTDSEHGLSFRFMEDIQAFNFLSDEMVTYEQIMTGHNAGTITINIIEADDSEREKIRKQMNEPYRTILGHFRHEIGHYYWDYFIARSHYIEEFRQLFGDERNDYKETLTRYYQQGAASDWHMHYISAYASSHPWEDWAETWAHYLHCIDILETASHHHMGINLGNSINSAEDFRYWLKQQNFDSIIQQLAELTTSLNELNRSLGLKDAYPFEHSDAAHHKLAFIHKLVMSN